MHKGHLALRLTFDRKVKTHVQTDLNPCNLAFSPENFAVQLCPLMSSFFGTHPIPSSPPPPHAEAAPS